VGRIERILINVPATGVKPVNTDDGVQTVPSDIPGITGKATMLVVLLLE
jgi:hypothetical protein